VYVFENNIPRCGRSLHLYVLFITEQYQTKFNCELISQRYQLNCIVTLDLSLSLNKNESFFR
jgi:hypothetical protein